MIISYRGSPRFAKSIDKIGFCIEKLISEPMNDQDIREYLNMIISTALELRVNIEHEKKSRGEIDEE